MMDTSTKYVVVKDYGVISKRTDHLGNRWFKRFRCVSWNGQKPLLEIREWSQDDTICRDGMRLNWKEFDALADMIDKIREEQQRDREAEAGVVAEASQSIPERVSENMESTL